jgi:hypothetical protein
MQKTNEITLTGTFKTEQVTPTFTKQLISFASKDRDGNWKDGDFEIYVKPDLVTQSGIQNGDLVKLKGFMVFNFFTKTDGTQMTFPKMIVGEVLEREVQQAGAQQPQTAVAQPTQPTTMAPTMPPMPGAAPQAPQAPQAPAMPQMGGVPPVPPAPVPPAPAA